MSVAALKQPPVPQLVKCKSWLDALRLFLFANLGEPIVYGFTDCHFFVLRCLDQITGQKISLPFTGKWRNPREGIRAIQRFGQADEWLAARGLYPVQEPCLGDIVIYDCLGGGVEWPYGSPALAFGEGLVIMPLEVQQCIGLAPMDAIGNVGRVLRVPLCLRQ